MIFDLIIQNQPNSEPVQCNVCKYVGRTFDTHYVRMLLKLLKRTHGSEITSDQFLFEKIRWEIDFGCSLSESVMPNLIWYIFISMQNKFLFLFPPTQCFVSLWEKTTQIVSIQFLHLVF